MCQTEKRNYHAHLCIYKSIRLLKKFFQSKTETYFPASKLLKAVLYHQPPLDLIQSILYIDPYASHPRICSTSKIETTALQIAIQNDASIAVIEELIRANPYTLFIRNNKLDPLTCAQIWRSDDKELMESLQRATKLWDVFGTEEDDFFVNYLSKETSIYSLRTIDMRDTKFFNDEDRDPCNDHDLFRASYCNDYDRPQMENDFSKISSNTLSQPRALPGFASKNKGEYARRFTRFSTNVPSFQQNVIVQAMEHINRSISLNLKEISRENMSKSNRGLDLNLRQSQARYFVLSNSTNYYGDKSNSIYILSSKSDSALVTPVEESISVHI